METLLIAAGIAAVFVFFFFLNRKVSANTLLQSQMPDTTLHMNLPPSQDGAIRFSVYRADPDEIKELSIGESVKLWMRPKNPEMITIYRRGELGGRIGFVPEEYFEAISPYVNIDNSFTAIVAEKDETSCVIEYRKKTTEETLRSLSQNIKRLAEVQANLKEELTKKYKPQKAVEIELYVSRKTKVKQDAKFSITFESVETYINQISLSIEFKNEDGRTVGFLSDSSPVMRILKAHFNGYQIDIENMYIPISHTKDKDPLRLLVKPYLENKPVGEVSK
jgi:hypothetical protein